MLGYRWFGVVAAVLLVAACGKGDEAPAAGGAEPAKAKSAATAEEAFTMARTAIGSGDFATVWALTPVAMRAEVEATIKGLADAPDEALAGMGLTRAEVGDLTPASFYAKMMGQMPEEAKAALAAEVAELSFEKVDDTRTKASFKRGDMHCETELSKEADGWKVGMESCEGGG